MTEKIRKNKKIVLGNQKLETYKDHSLIDYVLRVIWREHKISRAEIARKLGLSRSTVTEIVKELINTDFVLEIGSGDSSGGRRPILLEFQDNAKFILGIDIGATHIAVAVTNLRGKLQLWKEEKYQVRDDPDGTWESVINLCKECIKEFSLNPKMLMCIGVAFPSPVDPSNPKTLSEGIIPGWHGESGIEKLLLHFNVPIFVDNDANLGALAEHWWGAGRGIDDLVYIKLANGIGAGFILGGEIYRGSNGIAGEMSHMSIDGKGNQCGCGLKGCLATYLASWALEARTMELTEQFPDSPLCNIYPKIRMIEEAAIEGDELALKVVEEASNHLTVAITSLINMINPTIVVIGGSLTRLGDILLGPIREIVNKSNLVISVEPSQLKTAELGTKATAIGAATLALEETFAEPNFLNKRQHAGSV